MNISSTLSGQRNWSNIQEEISHRKFPRIHKQLWLLLQRGMVKYLRVFWPQRILGELRRRSQQTLTTMALAAECLQQSGLLHASGVGVLLPSRVIFALMRACG